MITKIIMLMLVVFFLGLTIKAIAEGRKRK